MMASQFFQSALTFQTVIAHAYLRKCWTSGMCMTPSAFDKAWKLLWDDIHKVLGVQITGIWKLTANSKSGITNHDCNTVNREQQDMLCRQVWAWICDYVTNTASGPLLWLNGRTTNGRTCNKETSLRESRPTNLSFTWNSVQTIFYKMSMYMRACNMCVGICENLYVCECVYMCACTNARATSHRHT